MDAVILFSHGSVLCGSGGALSEHAERMREKGDFKIVEVGYLNYSDPPFTEAVHRCVEQSATRIFVVPYFLVPGKFVTFDLPRAIDEARRLHSDVRFVVAKAIGYDDVLADSILDSAANAVTAGRWREDYNRASLHCRDSASCPLYGTDKCPRLTSSPCEACLRCDDVNDAPNQRMGRNDSDLNKREPSNDLAVRKALLVIAHGSPKPTANADLYRLLDLCRDRGVFYIVQEAFLECNEPSIPTAIDLCAASGASEIVAVPYFLHTGKHVADDLPTLLEEGQRRHPSIRFLMGDFIGRSACITDILEKRLHEAIDAITDQVG